MGGDAFVLEEQLLLLLVRGPVAALFVGGLQVLLGVKQEADLHLNALS